MNATDSERTRTCHVFISSRQVAEYMHYAPNLYRLSDRVICLQTCYSQNNIGSSKLNASTYAGARLVFGPTQIERKIFVTILQAFYVSPHTI